MSTNAQVKRVPKFNMAEWVQNTNGIGGIVCAAIYKNDGWFYSVQHEDDKGQATYSEYAESELTETDEFPFDLGLPEDPVQIASADVEHIYAEKAVLPTSLHKQFPNGACVVFANGKLTAAIPATNEQTDELADLMEQAAISWPVTSDDMQPYRQRRDELCAPFHFVQLTALFKDQMELERNREDKLACAARNN